MMQVEMGHILRGRKNQIKPRKNFYEKQLLCVLHTTKYHIYESSDSSDS